MDFFIRWCVIIATWWFRRWSHGWFGISGFSSDAGSPNDRSGPLSMLVESHILQNVHVKLEARKYRIVGETCLWSFLTLSRLIPAICFLYAPIAEGTPHDELEDDMAPGPGPMMADATTAKRALIRSRFSSYILHLLFVSQLDFIDIWLKKINFVLTWVPIHLYLAIFLLAICSLRPATPVDWASEDDAAPITPGMPLCTRQQTDNYHASFADNKGAFYALVDAQCVCIWSLCLLIVPLMFIFPSVVCVRHGLSTAGGKFSHPSANGWLSPEF